METTGSAYRGWTTRLHRIVHRMLIDAGDPYRFNVDALRINRHNIRPISRSQTAQRVIDAKEACRICRGKLQCAFKRNAEKPNAVPDGARHIETRSGQRAIASDASAVLTLDRLPVQAETRVRAANRRHGVGHQHRGSFATQGKTKHSGVDMLSVDDHSEPDAWRLDSGRNRARL